MSGDALEIAAARILAIECAHPVRVGIDGRSAAGNFDRLFSNWVSEPDLPR